MRSDSKRSLWIQGGEVTIEPLKPRSREAGQKAITKVQVRYNILVVQTRVEKVAMVRIYPMGPKLGSLAHKPLHSGASHHSANSTSQYLIRSLLFNSMIQLLCCLNGPHTCWHLYFCSHCSLCLEGIPTSVSDKNLSVLPNLSASDREPFLIYSKFL